jgi:uncharacterized protein involved in exopolysaccharide biosynthesis
VTLGLLAGVAASFLLSPRYRASALVQALWESETDAVLRRVTPDVAGRKLLLVRGRVVARSLLQRLLEETTPYRSVRGEDRPPAERLEMMLRAVSVAPRGGDSYAIAYAHDDPETASRVANRLAELLVEEADEARAARSRTDPARLEARLEDARKALEEQREALQRARERPPVSRPGEQGTDTGRLARLAVQKAALAAELEAARARAGELRQEIAGEKHPSARAGSRGGAELERLRGQLADLRKRYTDQHPDVQALLRRIRRLEAAPPPAAERNTRVSSLNDELAAIEQQVDGLKRRQAALDVERARLTGGSPAVRPSAAELETLARELDEARRAYVALENEWRAAETAARTGGSATARFAVAQPAQVPTSPYFPNRIHFALVGLALGLAFGLGASLVAESRERGVRGPEDLRETLPGPLLAELPLVRTRRRDRRK